MLVAGGGVWRAVDQGVFGSGQGRPYEPWKNWREAKGPMALVSAAILAPTLTTPSPGSPTAEMVRASLRGETGTR